MKEIEDEIKYAVRRQEESIYRRKLRLKNPGDGAVPEPDSL